MRRYCCPRTYFYPRPPRGGRLGVIGQYGHRLIFLSTPSARRATKGLYLATVQQQFLSTPSARRATDTRTRYFVAMLFLSTPSARRATIPFSVTLSLPMYFYPRPPRGGRQSGRAGNNSTDRFLSTPSARRATQKAMATAYCQNDFYPRPPRGGRRGNILPLLRPSIISIHALREEGDPPSRRPVQILWIFLSTPSARRATAKTETKSLFSNKLYNILHEFRRALIYNGSKSYPNHAK